MIGGDLNPKALTTPSISLLVHVAVMAIVGQFFTPYNRRLAELFIIVGRKLAQCPSPPKNNNYFCKNMRHSVRHI